MAQPIAMRPNHGLPRELIKMVFVAAMPQRINITEDLAECLRLRQAYLRICHLATPSLREADLRAHDLVVDISISFSNRGAKRQQINTITHCSLSPAEFLEVRIDTADVSAECLLNYTGHEIGGELVRVLGWIFQHSRCRRVLPGAFNPSSFAAASMHRQIDAAARVFFDVDDA